MAKILEQEYWKVTNNLLHQLVNDDNFIVVKDDIKYEILFKIINSCKNNNYLISKLLIYGDVEEDILLNFIFYTAINNKKCYELFLNNPDKYGSTFMFPLTIQELPKIKNILTKSEYFSLLNELEVPKLINNLKNVSAQQLKQLFKTTYNFSKINPYSLKDQ